MSVKNVLAAACVFFGGAVYGLNTTKMRVTTSCQDARLYMDGGIDASIESGGLNFHRTIDVFVKRNLKDKFVTNLAVTHEDSAVGAPLEVFSGPGVKLVIHKDEGRTARGYPAEFEAQIGKDKYSVAMLCR